MTTELRIPVGCVTMDAEEMEYLEGGAAIFICEINKSQCVEIYRCMMRNRNRLSSYAAVREICGENFAQKMKTVASRMAAADWRFGWQNKGFKFYRDPGTYLKTAAGSYVERQYFVVNR